MLIARYTAKASGVVPTFNSGYQYTVSEVDNGDGIYTVEIYAEEDFSSCRFKDKTQLLTVEYLKVTSQVTSMKEMFYGCSKLTQLDVSNWDTSQVTSMEYMFNNCPSLTQLDVSNFNTSQVKDMDGMFYKCSSLTQLDLSNWDISKVSVNSMYQMFSGCSSLNSIEMNNTNITQLGSLLPTRPQDDKGTIYCDRLDGIDTSSIEAKNWNVIGSFLVARYTCNVSGVVPTFNSGYQYTVDETNNDGIYTVEIIAEEDFTHCSFSDKTKLLTVEYLKVTSNVISMNAMFFNCSSLTQLDVSNWDTSKVKDMSYTFQNCSSLTQLDVSNWDTSQVTRMYAMFDTCVFLTELDLSNWDTSQVTSINYIFKNCSSLNSIQMNNTNITRLEQQLPTRPQDDKGVIYCDDLDGIDVSSIEAKNWNVISRLVARYTCKASGVVPAFNNGYVYEVSEVDNGDGIYTVKIYADNDFTSCSFKDKTKLLTVEYLKVTDNVTNMNRMFQGCSSLTQLDVSKWNTIKVTNMSYMFYNCPSLTQLDVSGWDISNVTTMSYMFYNCRSLTQLDVSNWNTSNVTSMGYMFYDCSSLTQLDVSKWNTIKVTNMSYMFYGCSKLTQLDVSNWDTSRVGDIKGMFINCSSLTQLDVSNWDTSNVTDMYYMFSNCSKLTQLDLSNWDTSRVRDMNYMFNSCSSLNRIELNNTNITQLGNKLPTRPQDNKGTIYCDRLGSIDVSSIEAKNWNVISSFLVARYTANTSGVVPTFNSGYQYIVDEVNNDGIYTVEIYSYDDFSNCSFKENKKLLTVEHLKVTSQVTSMRYMFSNCSSLTQLDASNWDTSQVTDMYHVFYGCSSLTQLDVSNWDTSQVKDMDYMFYECSSLTQLDVSNWVTSNVTNMYSMFNNCSSLTQLDLSNWDTSQVVYMYNMFYNCSSLTQLDVSNWDTSKVAYTNNMFKNCSSLNNIIAHNISTSTLSKLVNALPTRTSSSPGRLNTMGMVDIDQVITSTAKSKYWDIYIVYIRKTKIYQHKTIMIGDKKIGSFYITELKKI